MSEPEQIVATLRTRVRNRGHRYQPYPRRLVVRPHPDAVPHGTQTTN